MKLATNQVAKRLKVTERHVRRLIDEKKLIAEKQSGKDWMITESSVETFEARNEKIKTAVDSFIKDFGASVIITSQETSDKLKGDGLPIQSKFIPFDEYLVTLFQEKREQAESKIRELPLFDENIGDAVASSLYNEFRECFVLSVNGAAITLAIILLEYAMKKRIYRERKEVCARTEWKKIEKFSFLKSIEALKNVDVFDDKKKLVFTNFNTEVRNNYMHYKVLQLIKDADMFISELPALNIHTGEVVIHKNVDVKEMPHLWFSAKKKFDNDAVINISEFCIKWTNILLRN